MGSDNIGAALVEIQMIVQHLLAFEHLVAFGIEPFFDDVASVSLSVIRTIRVQTYLAGLLNLVLS
jgi:hypothetical protein